MIGEKTVPASPLTDDQRQDKALLIRWCDALRFRIGCDGVAEIDQLPDPASFPDCFPVNEYGIGHLLGEVLGIAALKLFRSNGTAFPGEWSLDHIGQWLQALSCVDRTTDTGRLSTIHQVIDLAFHAPGRLPVLFARLDALGNDDLHRMATDAVRGLPVAPDLFEGLY